MLSTWQTRGIKPAFECLYCFPEAKLLGHEELGHQRSIDKTLMNSMCSPGTSAPSMSTTSVYANQRKPSRQALG